MCLHPKARGFDSLDREITTICDLLDEFDSCDYVNGQFCSRISDLCIVQLNHKRYLLQTVSIKKPDRYLCKEQKP